MTLQRISIELAQILITKFPTYVFILRDFLVHPLPFPLSQHSPTLEKLISTLQNFSLLEQFSTQRIHDCTSVNFLVQWTRERPKKDGHLERRERERKGGGGSRNDPPRRDCSSLHAWKQAERGHVSSGCRGDSAGFSSRCTKITSLPLSLSLSLSRTHTHSLCPLFKAPLMPGTEKSPRWSVPRCRSGSAN